jgi:hypothetical protein
VISSLLRVLSALWASCVVGAIGVATLSASVAQADPVRLSTCNDSALSQPFAPWGDASSYELAPGGDFESSAWTLNGGAELVSGSEPFAATGSLGSSSLSLPAGASAGSPATCVNAAYPTIRFFVAGTGTVAVQVVSGNLVIPSGVAVASGGWRATPVMLTGSAVTGTLSGGTAEVSLRLIALSGSPRVDDVFIDPWNRG